MLRRGLAYPATLLGLVGVVALLSTCGSQYALLMTIRAKQGGARVKVFDVRVKDIATGKVVLERIGEQVDPANTDRDISAQGQELRLAVEFDRPGNYLFYFLGHGGNPAEGAQFALRDYDVDDVQEVDVTLNFLVGDTDRDGFPACPKTRNAPPPDGITCGPVSCRFLDCDDVKPNVHPFAEEVCENGLDDDCSAGCNPDTSKNPHPGDDKCEDKDGDGVPAGPDCNDNDPCISPKIIEAKNMCGRQKSDWETPWFKACRDKLNKEGKPLNLPLCGDNIDQDCDGTDAACFTDKDCDGYTPPEDCDDNDKQINPGVAEKCGDGKDNNCNGVKDEGCVPCDVDGDQHAQPTNTDPNCKLPKDDSDDYDAGVHPETTKTTSGSEGGHVLGALRQFCSGTVKGKNGTFMRDIDHDGDKLPASQDGCPAVSCDKDGDGFKSASCNPPKSLEDCNDNDPKVFPGAPDLCGDGVAQNCVADQGCGCDKDGDKYCQGDCNDSNPNVHPWAVERCDSIDNDCDKLVDEGNPDNTGALMPTNVKSCNDDNDGQCAPPGSKLSGVCACSKIKPSGKRDSGNRVQCKGENLSANATPRCFEALQPAVERCDTKDWDCDGKNFDGTKPFTDKGRVCSTNQGSCKAGTVTGCDLSKKIPNDGLVKQVLTAQKLPFNPHWVCSPGTLFPVPEACNKEDDDCNGALLGGETDNDGDNYIKCGDCKVGTGRRDLKLTPTLKGCGDCKDAVKAIHPNAKELCDNVDNNCKPGDEGTGQCTGLSTCCATQKACRQLKSDKSNCNKCGNVCNAATTDRCTNGACRCGSAPPCTGDRNCVSGSCQCQQGGLCKGCCKNNNCYPGGSPANCGKGGVACKTCTTSNPCKNPVCTSSGNCTTSNKGDTTSCPGGQCRQGNCCTGCWDGSTCRSGTSLGHCGDNGDMCQTCGTSNPCKTASCSTGSCVISNVSNGSSCPGGTCYNGSCCTGCWDGGTCRSGTTGAYCGDDGNSCGTCGTSDPCKSASCATSSCVISNRSNGSGCPSGKCYGGSCCTGCWDGSSCRSGTTISHCGDDGDNCSPCSTSDPCKYPDCSSGSCVINNRNNGYSCPGGTCAGGSCCTGCRVGSSCFINNDLACGSGGTTSCTNCTTTAPTCKVGNCTSGSCDYSANAPDGSTCSGGTCAGGTCCTGCRVGSTCYVDDDNNCGSGGTSSCTDCTTSAPACQTGSCSSGSCSYSPVSDGTSCTNGTCYGGSCCTGCYNGSSCVAGTSDTECGTQGASCVDCTGLRGNQTCNSGSCS